MKELLCAESVLRDAAVVWVCRRVVVCRQRVFRGHMLWELADRHVLAGAGLVAALRTATQVRLPSDRRLHTAQ